MKGVTFEREAI